jgi:serine/threonine-protein kinase
MSLTVGARVGPFLVKERIGAGGMGEVYRATDTRLGRDVALKVLHPAFTADEKRLRRFEQEARAAAAVSHPNIVVLHDVGMHEGEPYLVTEVLEGHALRDELKGPLPLGRAIDLGRQLASALVAAHTHGVVHRDLKPENLFVTAGGTLKVLDFGIARLDAEVPEGAAATTETGAVLGTVEYMAPEQVRGQPADHRVDLFAAGCILYELASGRRAFHGPTKVETGYAILNAKPAPLDAPPAFAALVDHCLEKSVERRLQSAVELEARLKAMADDDAAPTRARPRRRWGPVAAIAALALAAGGSMLLHMRRGVAVTDHPLPLGKPEAQNEYRIGLQALRDGSYAIAGRAFERAAELDPSMAAAQLRAALYFLGPDGALPRKQHLVAAQRVRAQLEPRDLALLEVAEGLVRSQRGDDATVASAHAATERFPNDAELAGVHGKVLSSTLQFDAALAELDRALGLDSKFALCLAWKSLTYGRMGNQEMRQATIDRCLVVNPSSASCLGERVTLSVNGGDCERYLQDAMRLAELEPDNPVAQDWVAVALAANEAPLASVKVALDRVTSLVPEGSRDEMAHFNAFRFAALRGDLVSAGEELATIERLRRDDPDETGHTGPAMTLMLLYEEEGDDEASLRVGEDFVERASAWHASEPVVEAHVLKLKRKLGKIDDAGYSAGKNRLVDRLARNPPALGTAYFKEKETWNDLHRMRVDETPAQAAADLLGAPDNPLLSRMLPVTRLRVAAGHGVEALPNIRRIAARCAVMTPMNNDWFDTAFTFIESQLLLGSVLEETGDTAGACAAYAVVKRRWKDAKPRSVSLERAIARSAALGCP